MTTIQEAKSLLAHITPGEWRADIVNETDGDFYFVEGADGNVADTETEGDMRFIAAAPRIIRDLIAEIEGRP